MRVSSLGLDLWRYRVVEADFEVPVRYDIVESVGEGTFGKVCAAKDLHTRKLVAIKKIENSFEYLSMAMRTLRELRILRNMRHENVMGIRNVFVVDGKDTFEDVYVVSDLMEVDLATLIRSSQPLLEEQVQFFLYQVLRGMKYIHSAGVIHRDLKPRNLLVNSNCALKIADFGLSRLQDSAGMTQYVCTRWYRAPEVLCAWENYTQAVDVWSIGCIFAEMLLRRPLFPADNTADMLKLVVSLLGYPGAEDMRRIPNERCRSFIRSLPRGLGQDFSQTFPTAMPAAIEFLREVLRFGPDERPTVAEALELPYMERFFDPEDEPVRGPLDPSDFEFEGRMLDASALREELFLEVLRYHPQKYQEYMREQAALGHRRHDITRYRFLVGEETVDSLDSWN